MSPSSFFLLAGILLFAVLLIFFLQRPAPKPPLPRKEPQQRWMLYVLHLERLWSGEGPALEGSGNGLRLSPAGAVPRDFRTLALLDGSGEPLISIDRRQRFGKEALRIRLGRESFGELRSARNARGLPELIARKGEPLSLAEAGDTIEIRRGAKLIAQTSPAIAATPDAVGVEILAAEEPLSILAVVTALWIMRPPRPPAPPKGAPSA